MTKKPSKPRVVINKATADKIVHAVSLGMEPARAAMAVGVGDLEVALRTRPALAIRIKKAEAEAEFNAIVKVHEAADGWQSAKWLLEHVNPERWAKPAVVQHLAAPRKESPDDSAKGEVVPESQLERLRREREEKESAAQRAK